MLRSVAILFPTILALLFSGCVTDPDTPKKLKNDPTLTQITNIKHLSDMSNIAFEWSPIKDSRVVGFYIYRDNPDESKADLKIRRYKKLDNKLQTHFVDSQLRPETVYNYRFTTYDSENIESIPSKLFPVSTRPLLKSVSFFKAVPGMPRMTKLIWRPHTENLVNGYVIERNSVTNLEWREVAKLNNRFTAEYVDKDLEYNRLYRYRIKAVTYNNLVSLPSDSVSVVTKPLPIPVQNIKATKDIPREIHIKWSPNPEKDISHYNIYGSMTSIGFYKKLAEVKEPIYLIKTEKDKDTYYIKISAVDKDGYEGERSSPPVLGSSLSKPFTPTIVHSTIKDGVASIAWRPNDARTVKYAVTKTAKKGWIDSDSKKIMIDEAELNDNNIQPNMKYTYEIRSIDKHGIESEPTAKIELFYEKPKNQE